MTSKNGRPELISLLQYMKETRLDNPNIIVKDDRILKLAQIVEEVKESEEWEAVKMSILSIGIEKGKEEGKIEGKIESKVDDLLSFLSELGPVSESLRTQISEQRNLEVLSRWIKIAARSETVEAFKKTAELSE